MTVIGTTIAGRYRVERELGRGGMGVVVLARHLELNEDVALKLIHPDVAGMPVVADRLIREARHSFRISGEHVVRVLDVGRQANGAPFLVMEYLRGMDLSQLLKCRGCLPARTAASLVGEGCRGIAPAHALGIVHRDLKPANLFLARQLDGSEVVKVLDFGISRALAGEASELTGSDVVLGSPKFMAPEQRVQAGLVDARCDVWALGVTLYQLVTGSVPFQNTSLPEMIAMLARWSEGRVDAETNAAGELGPVLARCLALDPADRFANAGELIVALSSFVDSDRGCLLPAGDLAYQAEAVPTVACGPPQQTTTGSTHSAASMVTPAPGPRPRWPRRQTTAVAVVSVTALAAVATVVAMGSGTSTPAADLPPPPPPVSAVGMLSATPTIASTAPSALPAPSVESRPAATTRPRARPAPTPSAADPWGWKRR